MNVFLYHTSLQTYTYTQTFECNMKYFKVPVAVDKLKHTVIHKYSYVLMQDSFVFDCM